MSMNPSSVARQQRGEELERLRKENELLRKRLQLLEEAGGSAVQELNPGVSDFSPENAPSVVKQVEGKHLDSRHHAPVIAERGGHA